MNGLRIEQLESKLGLKKTKIYALIIEGKLPHPLKVGRASIWLEEEVNEALKALAARRDNNLKLKRGTV